MTITKIVLDLEQWGEHYPTGAVIYNRNEVVDSDFCDNANEYIEFFKQYEADIHKHRPEIVVHMNLADLDVTDVLDCVREVRRYLWQVMY